MVSSTDKNRLEVDIMQSKLRHVQYLDIFLHQHSILLFWRPMFGQNTFIAAEAQPLNHVL